MRRGPDAQGRSLQDTAIEHAREMFRMAYCVLRNSAEAEEAVQQALLRACEASDAVAVHNVRGWLATVVINEALHMRRRRERERRARTEGGMSSHCPRPHVLEDETRTAVRAALTELPDVTRAVVVLRVMLGYRGNEVAALLEIGPSDVSRRLYAGLDALRVGLQDRRPELIEEHP